MIRHDALGIHIEGTMPLVTREMAEILQFLYQNLETVGERELAELLVTVRDQAQSILNILPCYQAERTGKYQIGQIRTFEKPN